VAENTTLMQTFQWTWQNVSDSSSTSYKRGQGSFSGGHEFHSRR